MITIQYNKNKLLKYQCNHLFSTHSPPQPETLGIKFTIFQSVITLRIHIPYLDKKEKNVGDINKNNINGEV